MQKSRFQSVIGPSRVLMGCMVIAVCTLPGCWRATVIETGAAKLRKFATVLDFKQYLSRQIESERSRYWWNVGDIALGMPDAGLAPPLPGTLPEDGGGFSTTNIQEAGVDESDVFKTDGTHLYILDGYQLHTVRAVPADDMEVVSTLELQHDADEVYLREDTLVLLGQGYDSEAEASVTIVTIFDVSDRSTPSVVATVEVLASLITSRLIGSELHLVVSMWPTFPYGDQFAPVMLTDMDALIPDLTVTLDGGETHTKNVVDWNDLYYPVDPDGYHVTAVVTLDVDAPETPIESAGVVANAGTVYVSTEALYLTDTDYKDDGRLRETTDVYKFNLTEDGAMPAGSTFVPGRVLNRFSLSEYQGYLRIATTVGNVWAFGESSARNHVYVLGPEGDQLVIVGKVEDIAPGERIYAARFVGDRGFLVTFKKVDPLFTLDLSDPTSPVVVGELKVPGYSDYIHPLGENHLLTIGKDAVDMGNFAWYQGVQVSVFDVTDFANPQQVDAEIVGVRGTESEALHNPHAFTYFAPAGMLAVPMVIAEGPTYEPSMPGTRTFGGLCLFTISPEDGVELVARVATRDADELPGWGWREWMRSVFIGNHVYAVTRLSVQAISLDELDSTPMELRFE